MAAWVAYDADQQSLARQLTHEALLASQLAGDRYMRLFELAGLSMQSLYVHRAAEARQIADEVLDENRLSGRTEALFRIRRGRALAEMGELDRGLDELGRAAALGAEGVGSKDPEWTWWLDESELAWQRAMVFASGDDWRSAVDPFRLAVELRPPHAWRALYNDRAHQLEAEVRVGAWSDVEATLARLIVDGGEIGSARTAALLTRTLTAIRRQRSHIPSTLTDHADELARVLAYND